jgi:serine/threonine protein phosphatase PrpC
VSAQLVHEIKKRAQLMPTVILARKQRQQSLLEQEERVGISEQRKQVWKGKKNEETNFCTADGMGGVD